MRGSAVVVYRAAAVRDAAGCCARPGAVAVAGGRVVAAGEVGAVCGEVGERSGAGQVDLGECLLMPALVNAHAHLGLSAVGPRAYGGAFTGWLREVMELGPRTREAERAAVRRGAVMSIEHGVGWIGDIAGSVGAAADRAESGLGGVSYLECFGIGLHEAEAVERLTRDFSEGDGEGSIGLQPHAPYSCGLGLYREAAGLAARGVGACARGVGLCTHLAETTEEVRFVRDGDGPFAEMLRAIGRWDQTIRGTGQHPVDWLAPVLAERRWLLAHCNYIEGSHIGVLAGCGASVVYCPVASDYFGHHRPDEGVRHRYREMIEGGVNVCLGTDSVVCQPVGAVQPLGVLGAMRHLYRRDGVSPELLLRMATVNGIAGLAGEGVLGPEAAGAATLGAGVPARLIAVGIDAGDSADPLEQVLINNEPARLVTGVDCHA